MSLFNKIFSKNKSVTKDVSAVDSHGIEANAIETDLFLRSLIGDLTPNFTVDSKENSLVAYKTVSQLNTVISSSAKAFIRAEKNLYDVKNGVSTLATKGELYDILKKPHFLQPENDFWETAYINYQIFGNAYIYTQKSIGFGYTSMFCLATEEVTLVLKEANDYLKAKEANDIIKKYLVEKGEGTSYSITDVNTVWTLQTTSLTNKDGGYAYGDNPLKPIEEEIATLKIIADIKKDLLSNHGAMGIISPDSKDSAGAIPLLPKDKEELQKEYKNYGIQRDKHKLLITNKSVKFTSISLKIAELQLTEFENEASRTLANNFQYPVSLLTSDAKYANQDSGNKELYENKVIPESSIFDTGFNQYFKTEEKNQIFKFEFDHITFLQADQKELAERNKVNSEIIISYNKSVQSGAMSRESAIYALTFQGVPEQESELLISIPKEPVITEITATE